MWVMRGGRGHVMSRWGIVTMTLSSLYLKKPPPFLRAMETIVSARINTAQPNDHSLENTTIKNSARVSSLWSSGTAWPKNSNQNSFLPIHFDWKADAQLLVWELGDFSSLSVNGPKPKIVKWLFESNDTSHELPCTVLILVSHKLFSSTVGFRQSFSGGYSQKCQSQLKFNFHFAAPCPCS